VSAGVPVAVVVFFVAEESPAESSAEVIEVVEAPFGWEWKGGPTVQLSSSVVRRAHRVSVELAGDAVVGGGLTSSPMRRTPRGRRC